MLLRNRMNVVWVIFALFFVCLMAGTVSAESRMEKPSANEISTQSPEVGAFAWLAAEGLEEGVNRFGEQEYYAVVGTALITVAPDHPDYLKARFFALKEAETDAQMTEGIGQSMLNFPTIKALRAYLQENGNENGVGSESEFSYGVKARGFARSEIEFLQNRVKKVTKKEDLEKIRLIQCGAFHSQGYQVLKTFAGPWKDARQVAVVCLWSQNMQCLAQKMLGEACAEELARRENHKSVKDQLLSDESELVGMSGVKAFIDEQGKFVLCAFGQAPLLASHPEKSASGSKYRKLSFCRAEAKQKAFAAISAFAGKNIFFYGELGADHIQRSNIPSKRISGIYPLLTKRLTEPVSGQPFLLVVMAWSPASQARAKGLAAQQKLIKKK